MDKENLLKRLAVPAGIVDVVLDTDAYNEIDDQFAIAYAFASTERIRVQAVYAAPFHNGRSTDPADGMEKSYQEIQKLLSLMGKTADVYKGSESYLADETTPVISAASQDLVDRAKKYTPENPLYIVAIGAITNIASALLFDPSIAQNIVIVWLGGHAQHYAHTKEFNMMQDYDAANVVLKSEAAFVQLPCNGVVSECRISKPELEYWLVGKNKLADYLAQNTIHEADSYALGKPWTRVIWDVTAVAWLLNDQNRFMEGRIINAPTVTHAGQYLQNPNGKPMQYIFHIERDALMEDLIHKLTQGD